MPISFGTGFGLHWDLYGLWAVSILLSPNVAPSAGPMTDDRVGTGPRSRNRRSYRGMVHLQDRLGKGVRGCCKKE